VVSSALSVIQIDCFHTDNKLHLLWVFFKLCVGYIFNFDIKKSLKIPKRKSESVIRRRTEKTMVKRKRADNTMVRRKSTKGQTTIYKKYVVNIKPTWESCHFKSHIDIAFYIVFIQFVFH
jgi:hypothetical protein